VSLDFSQILQICHIAAFSEGFEFFAGFENIALPAAFEVLLLHAFSYSAKLIFSSNLLKN
jgi:hypothetical protein